VPNPPNPLPFAGPHPFAIGASQPFTDNQPWLGGWIRVLGAQGANANLAVAHGLRVRPRFALLLDAGTTGAQQPLPRGATAWDSATIHVGIPLIPAGQSLVLLIA